MEPWQGRLNNKKIELLQNSWAGIFKDHILQTLPIIEVSNHYSPSHGCPTKDLVTVLGSCVLQQIFDLTDVETRDQLAFNEQWHYALDNFNVDDHVISLKTLWNMRNLLVKNELAKQTFNQATDKLAEVYQVDTRFQRLDSVHIHSNMAQLGRVRLLSRSLTIFLRNLKRHHQELYHSEDLQELKSRYEKDTDDRYFGNVKPSGSKKRLEEIAKDLHYLIDYFSGHPAITLMHSYKLLQRVFSEQCSLEDDQVIVKEAKEVSSDSVQNPSDPDTGYDGHKGPGYQVQLMETYSKKETEVNLEKEKSQLNLITYSEVESADNHDSLALEPALEETDTREMSPSELSADTLYGSEENRQTASEYGVELISPIPGRKPEKDLSSFVFNQENGEIEQCPSGNTPYKIKHNKKGSITAIWSQETCDSCSIKDKCPVIQSKQGYRLNYKKNDVRTILRRQEEQSAAFQEKYRYRSGIEATNSRYIQMTGARRLRYRGLPRVDYAATLKALGINMFRAAKHELFLRCSTPKPNELALNFS
jgi:hypothetical protein